ncbi:MAG: sirohydrochlorin cobaltochelatase [Acetobacteraceae bacterium]|nr:sirohydrochlorin cobaltochelatase [Acetobacteraceae bacterium]
MCANDALLLIGHGSARYPDAGRALHRHAETLRLRGQFGQVEAALLNGAPTVADALARIGAAMIRVVPFFMEDGYFSGVAVPRAIAEVERKASSRGDTGIIMCPPVGVHDGMAGLIERQALTLCAESGVASREAAVLVVGHGSSKSPSRALALHRHSARVAATELFARVEAAYLEEEPFVANALHGLRAHPVVVIGFFANHGGHTVDDLPALIAAEQAARSDAGRGVRFHGCIADDPAMAEIILDQARHAR